MTPKPPVKEIKNLLVNQRQIVFQGSQRPPTRACICPHPLLLPAVSRKVVHGDFHTLPLFELAQGVCQQVEVKGVRVVEVVIVSGSPELLFGRQDLMMATGKSYLMERNGFSYLSLIQILMGFCLGRVHPIK